MLVKFAERFVSKLLVLLADDLVNYHRNSLLFAQLRASAKF